jgi:hypothetical protein
VSSAVFGSILANRLPGAIQSEVARVKLPAGAPAPSFSGGSAQTLFDPAHLAALRAQVPVQLLPLFDQLLGAVRLALAHTLSEIFLLACAVSSVALVASLLLREVPLRQQAAAPAEEGTQAQVEYSKTAP